MQDFARLKKVDPPLSRISHKRYCTTLTLILTKGQPSMLYVGEADARRKKRMCEARWQGAETLKGRRAERGDDFYERRRIRQAGLGNEDEQ